MFDGTTRPIQLNDRDTASFWARVSKPDGDDGCWEWTGKRDVYDYGHFGKGIRAHRYAYTLLVGPIPPNLVIDHLCRVHCCVNPAHLEPVTNGENVLRGFGGPAENKRRTPLPARPRVRAGQLLRATQPPYRADVQGVRRNHAPGADAPKVGRRGVSGPGWTRTNGLPTM